MSTVSPSDAKRMLTDLDLVRTALDAEYEVLEELGRGGMAIVYRARERTLDREVAIKVLPFSLAFDADFVERFEREARTAAQLEHPHIIPIYGVGRVGQVIYFAMQLVRGQSLADRLRERGRLSVAEVRRVLGETAGALGYAAARGVVHRDIKPDNILLDAQGRSVVTDFGIAKSASNQQLTSTGMTVGTPRYMSPEQARSQWVDGRSDIYSLGVVGYQCLVGRTPFDGTDALGIMMQHVSAPIPIPALASADERALFGIIERMLAKDPTDRFQSADDIVVTLGGQRPEADATVPAPAVDGTAGRGYHAEDDGPRPSAALDRALDAGLELLKQQQPRVEAGLAISRRAVETHRPRVQAAARRAAAPVVQALRANVHKGPRFWGAVVAIALLCVASAQAFRVVKQSRSRCARSEASEPTVTAATPGAPANHRPFSLLVDAIGSERGSTVEVYYDVCGLDRGTTFTTRVEITKNESGLKRLFGRSVDPVTESFEETADGPAMRRHHRLDLTNLPAGSYALDIKVIDASARRREKALDFHLAR